MRCSLLLLSYLFFFLVSVNSADAGIQWLPDFQGKNPHGNITEKTGRPVVIQTKTCEDYGYKSSVPTDKVCNKYYPGSNLTCYRDCVCNKEFGTITFNVEDALGRRCGSSCKEDDGTIKYKSCCRISPRLYISCNDGYELRDVDTYGCGKCVYLADECPADTFKQNECLYGTLIKKGTTTSGISCYKCKDCVEDSNCKSGKCFDGQCVVSSCPTDWVDRENECPFGVLEKETKKAETISGEIYDLVCYKCKECASDSNCSDGKACSEGICISDVCSTGKKAQECEFGTMEEVATTEAGTKCYKCKECASDGNCSDGKACKNGICVVKDDTCKIGKKAQECEFGTLKFVETTEAGTSCYECKECSTDNNCSGGVCLNGKCSACTGDFSKNTTSCSDGQTLVSETGKPACKKCEGVACQTNFYLKKPTCGNGQNLCQQSTNNSCWGCCGTACDAGFDTVVSTCLDGQRLVNQGTNAACKKCEGVACQSGFSTSEPSCRLGQTIAKQESNEACMKCSGVPCQEGYSTSIPNCPDGQEPALQSSNNDCKGCEGVVCETGFSTKTTCDEQNYNTISQTSNPKCKKCEKKIMCPTGEKSLEACLAEDGALVNGTHTLSDGTICGKCTTCNSMGYNGYTVYEYDKRPEVSVCKQLGYTNNIGMYCCKDCSDTVASYNYCPGGKIITSESGITEAGTYCLANDVTISGNYLGEISGEVTFYAISVQVNKCIPRGYTSNAKLTIKGRLNSVTSYVHTTIDGGLVYKLSLNAGGKFTAPMPNATVGFYGAHQYVYDFTGCRSGHAGYTSVSYCNEMSGGYFLFPDSPSMAGFDFTVCKNAPCKRVGDDTLRKITQNNGCD